MFFLTYIAECVSWYGTILAFISVAGLVIGTFELAFNRLYGQVLFRMMMHVLCIPLAVYLSNLNRVADGISSSIVRQCVSLLSVAGLTVGVLGLSIAIIELGIVPATTSLLNRMGLYIVCIAIAIPFLPLLKIKTG